MTDAERRRRLAIVSLLTVGEDRMDGLMRQARAEAQAQLAEADRCLAAYQAAMAKAEESASELRGYLT